MTIGCVVPITSPGTILNTLATFSICKYIKLLRIRRACTGEGFHMPQISFCFFTWQRKEWNIGTYWTTRKPPGQKDYLVIRLAFAWAAVSTTTAWFRADSYHCSDQSTSCREWKWSSSSYCQAPKSCPTAISFEMTTMAGGFIGAARASLLRFSRDEQAQASSYFFLIFDGRYTPKIFCRGRKRGMYPRNKSLRANGFS